MSRDGKLPFSRLYNRVSPTLHTPVWVCLVVGALSAVPFLYYSGAGLVAIAATGMIYLSYLLGNIAILIARTKGWPTERAPFKLGGWGTIINVLGLIWGGSMLLNFLWPRPASNPSLNTLPNLTGLTGFLGSIPIFEATVVVIVVVGAIYYFIAQRGKRDEVVRAA
jgi:Amino acid permease